MGMTLFLIIGYYLILKSWTAALILAAMTIMIFALIELTRKE